MWRCCALWAGAEAAGKPGEPAGPFRLQMALTSVGGWWGHKGRFPHSGVRSRLTTASWRRRPWWVCLWAQPAVRQLQKQPGAHPPGSALSRQAPAANETASLYTDGDDQTCP